MRSLLTSLVLGAALMAGCASAPHAAPTRQTSYVLVYLKTGPSSGKHSKEEQQSIFAGHMSNMRRLADEKKLCVAGPFDKPHDPAWRGIFIMPVATVDEASALTSTDPGVTAQVFAPEFHAMHTGTDLTRVLELEKQLPSPGPQKAGEPPANIRSYAMVTAADFKGTRAAIESSSLAKKLVFDAAFEDTPGGFFVFDAAGAAGLEAMIAISPVSLGTCTIDTWYSTAAVAQLMAPAAN